MEPVPSHGLVYDVALSTRRMSLTSVQSLSEKVAPQPCVLHHTYRKRERERHRQAMNKIMHALLQQCTCGTCIPSCFVFIVICNMSSIATLTSVLLVFCYFVSLIFMPSYGHPKLTFWKMHMQQMFANFHQLHKP